MKFIEKFLIGDFHTPDRQGGGYVGKKSQIGDKKIVLPPVRQEGTYVCLSPQEKERCYFAPQKIRVVWLIGHTLEPSKYWRERRRGKDLPDNKMPIGILFKGERIIFPPFQFQGKEDCESPLNKEGIGILLENFFIRDRGITRAWAQTSYHRHVYFVPQGEEVSPPGNVIIWGEITTLEK